MSRTPVLHIRSRARVLALPPLLGLALVLGSCSSDEGSDASPEEVSEALDGAAERLDETSGVTLSLTTEDLPDGVTGITSAVGTATSAPAFDGALKVRLSGNEFEVPVVAVDGTVWARIPLTPGWSDVDPAEYGAPDPSLLISADHGFATLLTATDSAEAGDTERGGVDNREVLTSYTGTIDGEVMKNVIPSSAGDVFDAAYLINEDGELREATLTGVFYADSPEMTYKVDIRDYDTEKTITAP
ncbi:LppX_LprAFG lipoprotein [Nocardioides sp. 616]|uniref:LppX_LprAFG lipoprotein n=1 Tax=Nocardioides sp. 616 TaxID=2268090 RepID=UPI000CE49C8C|nr:LppX_LprAFG lipoprotein [Nocardioides sp. 616]